MFKWFWNKKLACYCAEHNPTIRADKNGNVFGGGSTKISQPSPPPAPSTKESVQAWADVQPQIYQQQLQYEPKLLEQQLAMQSRFAEPLLRQNYELQKEYAPDTSTIHRARESNRLPK